MNRLGHEFNNWLKKFRRSSSKKVHLSPVNNERFESKKLISNIPPRLQILVKIKFTITTHCSDYTKNKCVKIFRYWPRSELIFMRIFGTFLTNFRIHIYFFEWVVFDIIKWKIHSLQFLLKKLFLYRHFLICFTHEKRPVTFPHENFSWLNRHFWKLNSEYYYTSAVPQNIQLSFSLKSKPMQYLWSLYCTVWFVFSQHNSSSVTKTVRNAITIAYCVLLINPTPLLPTN